MKHIELIGELGSVANGDQLNDKAVNQLYNGAFRRIVEVRLRNNAVLSRHHADVPITIYCISGTGIFSAGADLKDTHDLRAGTLITLEAGVEHEVVADPELHILVSKFKDS
jgi:quercetin dioxygenase-like cupin family protein